MQILQLVRISRKQADRGRIHHLISRLFFENPHLITTRQEQHNIFPIRWLHVLKATIKLRSSNLRSRQMDAGFSGRWLRGHPLASPFSSKPLSLLVFSPPFLFAPSRVRYRRREQAKRANLAIQSATIKWRGGGGTISNIKLKRRRGCWMLAAARRITWINLDPNLARLNGSVRGERGSDVWNRCSGRVLAWTWPVSVIRLYPVLLYLWYPLASGLIG